MSSLHRSVSGDKGARLLSFPPQTSGSPLTKWTDLQTYFREGIIQHYIISIPVASTAGFNSMHFWPGVVSSSLVTLIPSIKRISPLLTSSALTFEMSRFSKIVAAERRMVFRKNDLSNSCISRLIGGRKFSGRFGEFIFCKFLDQTANLLVHRAIQTQEEILRISRKCALKRPPAANKIEYEPYAGSQIEIGNRVRCTCRRALALLARVASVSCR